MKRILIIAGIAMLATICSSGQNSIMDYNSFLKKVRDANPLMNQAANIGRLGEVQLNAARGAFDPQLSANSSQKSLDGVKYYTTHESELKQQLYTSQHLKAGYQYHVGSNVNPENKTSTYGIPYAGVEVSVLQGLGIDSKRAELKKATYMKEYLDAESRLKQNEVLFSAAKKYVELQYFLELKFLGNQFTGLAEERLNYVRNLASIGERATIDTVEASIQLQSRQLEIQGYDLELVKKYNDINTLTTMNTTPIDPTTVTADEFDILYEKFSEQAAALMLASNFNNPMIDQYRYKGQIIETEKRLKKEMIKPVLDISYNALHSINRPSDYVVSIENYKWSANFAMPLYLRKSRNEYKMASIYLENNQLELGNTERYLLNRREAAISSIKLLQQQINLGTESASLNQKLVDAERLKFNNGESTLFLLNQREVKWLETSAKLIELKLKYMLACIELIYLDGDLGYELN